MPRPDSRSIGPQSRHHIICLLLTTINSSSSRHTRRTHTLLWTRHRTRVYGVRGRQARVQEASRRLGLSRVWRIPAFRLLQALDLALAPDRRRVRDSGREVEVEVWG